MYLQFSSKYIIRRSYQIVYHAYDGFSLFGDTQERPEYQPKFVFTFPVLQNFPSCIPNHGICKWTFNTLRPRQNRRLFADDIIKCIFLNENVWITIKILLEFVYEGLINNIPALIQIIIWRRLDDKPLSEAMIFR